MMNETALIAGCYTRPDAIDRIEVHGPIASGPDALKWLGERQYRMTAFDESCGKFHMVAERWHIEGRGFDEVVAVVP